MPPIVRTLLPWLAWVVLVGMNASLYWTELRRPESTDVWHGRLMPGKPVRLPPRPESRILLVEPKEPYADEPLRDVVLGKGGAGDPGAQAIAITKGFVVEAGQFVLKLGAETLVHKMQKQGLKPSMEMKEDLVPLNYLQAGPFATLAEAREAEIKLKAGGLTGVTVAESWEGYQIGLGHFELMGYAMQIMEQADRLGVKPLRLVKVRTPLAVWRVWIGPLATREAAKEVSARIASLGLSVPVIYEYPREVRTVYSTPATPPGAKP